MTVLVDDAALRELERLVGDIEVGDTRVVGARAERRWDDEPFILVTLVLADPPPGALTWSVDETFDVREEARRRMSAARVTEEVKMTYTAEHGDVEGNGSGSGE